MWRRLRDSKVGAALVAPLTWPFRIVTYFWRNPRELVRAVVPFVVAMVAQLSYPYAIAGLRWVYNVAPWELIGEHVGVVLPTLIIGTLLYLFRCRSPRWYGLSEIFVGVGAAYYLYYDVLPTSQNRLAIGISIAGAIYIIVRGYDNVYRSFTGHSRRRWNSIFFGSPVDEKLA